MSASSLFSSSSSSSLFSSPDSSPTFPSSASAATRLRRKRRDAISRAAESEWDPSPSTASASPPPPPPHTSTLPPWRRADELICPLASSDAPLPPFALPPCLMPPTTVTGEDDADELQAMLARFSFPSPPPSTSSRKHRRSGEIIDHSSITTTGDDTGADAGTRPGRETGPVRRAPCAHCESGPSNLSVAWEQWPKWR